VASPNKINLILSLSKDEAAASAAGNLVQSRRVTRGTRFNYTPEGRGPFLRHHVGGTMDHGLSPG